jgi:hypothetical protein
MSWVQLAGRFLTDQETRLKQESVGERIFYALRGAVHGGKVQSLAQGMLVELSHRLRGFLVGFRGVLGRVIYLIPGFDKILMRIVDLSIFVRRSVSWFTAL